MRSEKSIRPRQKPPGRRHRLARRSDRSVLKAQRGRLRLVSRTPSSASGTGARTGPRSLSRPNGVASSNGQNHATITGAVDKSALPISAPRRVRDKDHLRFVASQPCLVCRCSPGHAHHIRFAQPRAMGRKVSDEWTVPLCATHHRSLHSVGDEGKWWKARGIDPIPLAERFWQRSRYGVYEKLTRAQTIVMPGTD